MRPLRFHYAVVAAIGACAAPRPPSAAPAQAALPAPLPSACDLERRAAEAHRDGGFWLRARQELETLLARCPNERPKNEAALVDLVIGLEDAASAARLLPNLEEPSLARLGAWLEAWRAKQAPAPVAFASELRALRTARAQGAPNALELSETALAHSGARGELLAEIGLLRLRAGGPREAQPYFDRARVALERETGRRPTAFALAETLSAFDDAAWTPDAREMWLWGRGGLDGFAPERARSPYASTAVVFDTQSWEPIWRLGADSRNCTSLPLANGAGFVRCDGVFARDGRRISTLPEQDSGVQLPYASLDGEQRLLFARNAGEHSSQLALLDPATGALEPLALPAVKHVVALGAAPGGRWFFVESVAGLDVFAYPSLERLLRIKASDVQVLGDNQLAFVAEGELRVWQLRPPKRLARHYFPEIVIPHGSIIGASYFRSARSDALWVQHLGSEWAWPWKLSPFVSPGQGDHATPDELPNQTLLGVTVSQDQRFAAELLRDSRLESEQLLVASSDGTLLQADAPLQIKDFAISPGGKRLALNLGGKTLSLLELDATSAPRTLDFTAIRRLAFWDDEHLVLELPRETWLVDARDGSHESLTLRSGEHFFARGRSGVTVATGYSGGAVTYDARDRLMQSFFELAPVALSPSGEWLLLRGSGRLVLASAKEGIRSLLLAEKTDVELWRFSQDEHRLATLGAAGLVVWDTAASSKWSVSARAPLGSATSLEFDETNDVVVLGAADGTASGFRYQSSERVAPPPIARAPQDQSRITWSSASRFLRAFRRGDGKWLGALALTSNGARALLSDASGEMDFLGGEPVLAPRCAFGNLLVAWPVCSDTLRVPGLLARWQK